jgi:hypothetical protein
MKLFFYVWRAYRFGRGLSVTHANGESLRSALASCSITRGARQIQSGDETTLAETG